MITNSQVLLSVWESKKKRKCTDHAVKLDVLKALVKQCGLSVSGGVGKLRKILDSLRQHALPLAAKAVDHELVNAHNVAMGGDGLRSRQQRSFRLLALMDPALEPKLGLKREPIKTGDFAWSKDKTEPLWQMINEQLGKWVRRRPPFGFDETQSSDLWFWEQLRNASLTWVKSHDALEYTVWLYKIYAGLTRTRDLSNWEVCVCIFMYTHTRFTHILSMTDLFTKAIENSDRWTVNKCLEMFFTHKIKKKEAVREETERRLTGILTEDVVIAMRGRNVVDAFSFLIKELQRAVFNFFKSQVKVRVQPSPSRRFKDREDMAKTYFLGGVVKHSVERIIMRRQVKNVDRQVKCVRGFCVSADTAAKHGLPTRHVVMKTGGGLVYPSKEYYEIFSKMEDYFYCTVNINCVCVFSNNPVYISLCFIMSLTHTGQNERKFRASAL